MRYLKCILVLSVLTGVTLSTRGIIQADETPSVANPDSVTNLAIEGLANAESQASNMIQVESNSYLFDRGDVLYKEGNHSNNVEEIIAYLSAEKVQKRISRWVQNKKIGKLDEIWYSFNKNTSDAYSELVQIGFDGENTYNYYAFPNSQTGNGNVSNGGSCANGYLIGSPWDGDFSSAGDFSSELSAANPHFVDKEKINGLDTLKITASSNKNDSKIDYTVWICPERSFRCVRTEIQESIDGSPDVKGDYIYETLSFKKYNQGGLETWLPQKGVSLDFLVDNTGKRYWRTLKWFNLLEVKPLPQLTQSVFAFQFPLGTTITDATKQIVPITTLQSVSAVTQQLKDMKLDKDIHDFVQQVVDKKIE